MKKIGRNDPCPCGSGKKYKKCCELKESLPKKIVAHKIERGALSGKVSNIGGLFQKMVIPNPVKREESPPSEMEEKAPEKSPETPPDESSHEKT